MTSFGSPWRDPVVTGPRLLVRISVGYPTDHEFYFTDGAIVDSGFGTGTASVGQATTAFIGKISPGTESEEGFTVVLRNVKPYADNANTDLIYTDLVHLFTYYVFEGATAYLYQYADSIVASDDRTVLSIGTVESVTDLTPSTVTLKITEDNLHRSNKVTARSVGDAGWYAMEHLTPDLSKGSSLPLRLGPRVYIPKGWEYWYDEDEAVDLIHSGHQRASILPARLGMLYNEDLEMWDHQEMQSGVVNSYSQATHSPVAFSYVRDTDSFARFPLSTYSNDTQARAHGNQYWRHDRDDHYIEALLIPKRMGYVSIEDDVINKDALFDRRMDTVCTLRGHTTQNREVNLIIPNVPGLGGIVDVENSIQVWIYTLGSQPPGTIGPAAGIMQVGIGHPNGGTWALSADIGTPKGVVCNYTGWRASTRDPGGDEYPAWDTWRGTRWQKWDFTAASANDRAADRDAYVYVTDAAANEPFTIRIRLVAGNPAPVAHILAVGLFVRFRQDSGALYGFGKKDEEAGWYKWMRGVLGKGVDEDVSWFFSHEKYYRERGLYDRSPYHLFGRELVPAANVESTEQTFAWNPGLHDGTDAYGTGGDWIESPGPIINYLATQYGKRGFVNGSTTTWGSVKWFDAMMTKWAKLHNPSASKFRMFYWHYDGGKVPVSEELDRIFDELPGMARKGVTSTGIASLICTTHDTNNDEYLYAKHACTTVVPKGISVERDILMRPDGSLAFEQTRSPASSIINEIEIKYQYDITTGRYGATATCSPTASDDGFGAAWPVFQQASASTICTQSQGLYTSGNPRKKTIDLKYHWYPETAVAVGCWYLWRHWRPYVVVRFEGALSCQDIMPGQIIEFNDDVRTIGGMGCSIPWTNTSTWFQVIQQPPFTRHMRWHVLSNTRMNEPYPGRGVYYEVIAMEHLSVETGFGAMSGGPVIAGEGFDGIL